MGRMRLATTFVCIIAIAAITGCHAQSGMDAVQYINEVQTEIMQIAQDAVTNFMNSCELVATCGGNCSRQACVPLATDEASYVCKHVANNSNCYSENGILGCQDLRVSLGRSFVRLPTGSNVSLTAEANATICSQRMLDPTFKNISSSHNSLNFTTWTYFASVEGVHRAFPGRDVAPDNCTFEPRLRPWYMGAIAVKKDVVVLLDTGNSMGGSLPGDLLVAGSTTKLQAIVSMVNTFLETLAQGDRITIVTFNSQSNATAVLAPITVNANVTNLQPLQSALQTLQTDNDQGVSNLTAGFITANQTFQISNALKVILTFTDGQVTPVLSGNGTVFDNIRSLKTLVQIFSLDRVDTEKEVLSQLACSCTGTYERIVETIYNPLWTLRSYYGILARTRLTALNNTPAWTAPYQDDGSLGTVITVVYPAFADNYTLVGVAGMDVMLQVLGGIAQSDFSSALINYGNTASLPGLVAPAIPCDFTLSAANNCTNVNKPENTLCPTTDTSGMTFQERVCSCFGVCLASAPNPHKHSLKAGEIAGIGVGVAIGLLLLAALVHVILRKKRGRPGEKTPPLVKPPFSDSPPKVFTSSFESTSTSKSRARGRSLRATNSGGWGSKANRDLREYTQEELSDATDNWSESAELGRGAHGLVYKGTFADGTIVAIKKPTRDVGEGAWETFTTELELLSKLNHKRLVRLLGYCKEEIILVYEFMENGTLSDWLHSNPDDAKGAKVLLDWDTRLRIAVCSAKGLEYLHEYATPKIYHGDVKPANILLDGNWDAHVSDFGLSLWSQDEKNSYLMASRMGGTFGYLDPEFVSCGQATFASDVYSFGIVLLELMSGRPVVVGFENIKDWAATLAADDALEAILDPAIDEEHSDVDVLIEVIRLALRCCERKKQDRPKMKDVASTLDQVWAFWLRAKHSIPEESAIEPR